MDVTALFSACATAMVAVFALLGFLAAIMDVITRLFPERRASLDPVIVAAISNAVATVFPGARVTRIEEEK
jgi:hypothetical protein